MFEDSNFIYFSSIREAKEELERRRSDMDFRSFVDEVFGTGFPAQLFGGTARAIMSRYIASPTIEFMRFYKECAAAELSPLIFEYAADKFVAKNMEKYSLCRLSFVTGDDQIYKKTEVRRIVDFNTDEGKRLRDIYTLGGEVSLVDFHHAFLQKCMTNQPIEIVDFSEWFIPNRGSDKWSYYLRYLSMFLYHGILFENFLMDHKEYEFTTSVVIPAFRTITDIAGYPPIIVRTLPVESENDPYWCYYDADTTAFL